jgi:hypothetical protein
MEKDRYITVFEISEHYGVEPRFIFSLAEHGLLEIVKAEETECVSRDCLADIERVMRLHYDLEINLAGVEAIWHLLERMKEMQEEMRVLRNRLTNK